LIVLYASRKLRLPSIVTILLSLDKEKGRAIARRQPKA
jgi:hypothetical protein